MAELSYACARIGCAARAEPTGEQRCPACGHATHPVGALVHRGGPTGRLTVLVSDLELAGGSGHRLAAGLVCDLVLSTSAVLLQSPQEHVWAEIALEDVTVLEVTGPVDEHDAGRPLGMDVEVGGITVGLVSEVLTVFSEAKTIIAVVRLGARGCEYVLTHPYAKPSQLRAAVAPLTIALRDLRHDRERGAYALPAATGGGLADQLATLARLHGEGSLTDEEFAAAKRKLLD